MFDYLNKDFWFMLGILVFFSVYVFLLLDPPINETIVSVDGQVSSFNDERKARYKIISGLYIEGNTIVQQANCDVVLSNGDNMTVYGEKAEILNEQEGVIHLNVKYKKHIIGKTSLYVMQAYDSDGNTLISEDSE